MNEFPPNLAFKYPWRKYQQRVLSDLQEHLTNRHLHLVAPPGSGKTVLGLEVAIRLNKPTLILVPTLAIRNQWIQRFCELFLQSESVPAWISRDVRNPGFLTVITYQGLHAACANKKAEEELEEEEDGEENRNIRVLKAELEAIVIGLKRQQVATFVLDEAHHLKNEWWQTLSKLKERLNPVVIGLTATPPYDVTAAEWQRYTELNGPVDTEVSVPELMVEGDLCPHQDFVYFTHPTAQENKSIVEFRDNVQKVFHEIKEDEILVQAIENHRVWLFPMDHLDWVYTNISFYSACLIFLHSNGKEIPATHLEILGHKKIAIPDFDYEWAEILLDFYLYQDKDGFKRFETHRQSLENRLKRYGAIERRKICLSHNKRITGVLSSSISKLNGIKEIVSLNTAGWRTSFAWLFSAIIYGKNI